jgi:cytochrome c553
MLSSMAVVLMTAPLTMAQLPKSAKLFDQNCVSCHANTAGSAGPEAGALRKLTPEAIVAKLDSHGAAAALSNDDKRAIAEYLSGRNYMAPGSGDAAKMPQGQSSDHESHHRSGLERLGRGRDQCALRTG